MFSTRVRAFCIRRSPIRRFQTSSHHYVSLSKSWKYRPKSGNDWTVFDLESYNISIDQVDPLQFFGLKELPEPTVDQELLNFTDADAMQQVLYSQLINLLGLVGQGETAVCDFSVKLLEILGYLSRDRVARARVDLPLFICHEDRYAKTDVCIVDRSSQDSILLVLQEAHGLSTGAQPQLIAEGVAGFDQTNLQRDLHGLPPLAEKVMPGIIMVGTLPAFFKIPVTQSLLCHIGLGVRPPTETHVTYCFPSIPARRRIEGMKPVDNRREILKSFEAFKAIVGI